MSTGLVHHPDGQDRCWWPGTDPLYVAYHDTEWGVPEHDDRALFEKLILDGFQAGLSWITILRRRDRFRRAFADFEPAAIARFGEAEVEALMRDEGIIRNRAKIVATVRGARAYLAMQERGRGFSDFLWDFVDGRPLQGRPRARADVATETEVSRRISKALRAEGFGFCGPTIVHAFMQAVGMVNDHLVGCCRHGPCAALPGPGGRGSAP
ncbi:DNA-3-methyladenine glycosylase 1 [Methylobacterium crusticola]|uniref:DNA-3-methyladenine glycosylase 1 n=1 Tax=Methylobacterium crusticola TaxID=1697972 RepID=A0ABQ4QTN5_9HYPH|nr:DNA-3-methyladenine glycosylase I [Methylobacterium crusticola]GJD48688.1 DNA-3-methyladenine glycosylase 1 [Methylobacterium crusticola]